jgi:hypothetical protein
MLRFATHPCYGRYLVDHLCHSNPIADQNRRFVNVKMGFMVAACPLVPSIRPRQGIAVYAFCAWVFAIVIEIHRVTGADVGAAAKWAR